MLLIQSSLVYQPFVKFPFQNCAIPKVSLLLNKNSKISSRIIQKNNAGMSFVRCNTPLQEPYHNSESDQTMDEDTGEIGIMEFFKGKTIFVIGASAVGIAFVEKLLRSTEVGKIYLLVSEEDKEDQVHQQLKEVIAALSKKKVIVIVGDMFKPDTLEIMKEVDVIVNTAGATAKLNEDPYNWMPANVHRPFELMKFTKRSCVKLKLFVHISSAYVNEEKKDTISESPLLGGAENESNKVKQIVKYHNVINLKDDDKSSPERAWMEGGGCTSYLNTKALGEMFLNKAAHWKDGDDPSLKNRKNVPLLIIRPTFIGSSYKEPFEGWMPKNGAMHPLVINAREEGPTVAWCVDLVPVDIVVNVTIAAIARHGMAQSETDLHVYNVATGSVMQMKKTFSHECYLLELENLGVYNEQFPMLAVFIKRIDTTNTRNLSEKMSDKEKINFDVDITKIDWRKYLDIP